MATVRFSNDLKGAIRNNAKGMFVDKLEKAAAAVPVSFNPNTIYELLFKDHMAEMDAMPEEYFVMNNTFSISTIRGRGVPDNMNQHPIDLDMGKRRRWPQGMNATVHGMTVHRRGMYGAICLNADDDRWSDELVAAYVNYCTVYDNIIESRDKFVKGVDAVIDTFSTLAPALKGWPALWDLLPGETKERHKEIVERKKRVVLANSSGNDEHEVVDLDSMTAAVVLTKLTQ
jgi:hypothetical protein